MAILTVQPITKAGIANVKGALQAADAAGDSVSSASGIFIVMENLDASAHTLTVARPFATANCGNLGALAVENIALSVAASETAFLAIPLGYADASGNFAWTYDAVTSVSVGAFSIAP